MIVKTLKPTDGPKGIQPAGTEISHRDAWRLVLLGVAEPADQECIDTLKDLADRQAAAAARREFIAGHRAEIAAAQPAPLPENRNGRAPMSTGPAVVAVAAAQPEPTAIAEEADTETE